MLNSWSSRKIVQVQEMLQVGNFTEARLIIDSLEKNGLDFLPPQEISPDDMLEVIFDDHIARKFNNLGFFTCRQLLHLSKEEFLALKVPSMSLNMALHTLKNRLPKSLPDNRLFGHVIRK